MIFVSANRFYVKLKLKNGIEELYSFNVPTALAKNLVIGKPFVDVAG